MKNQKKLTRHFISLSVIVCLGLFIITSILGLYYVYSIKRESAFNVTKVVEGMLKSHQYREAVYSLSNAKLGSFKAIGYYDFEGNRVFVLPPSLEPDYFKEDRGILSKLTTTNISVGIFFDENQKQRAGTITYAYTHASAAKAVLIFCVIGIIFLLLVLYKYKTLIKKSFERDLLEEKNKGIKETVSQVWHDLNQPMQLLYALAENRNNVVHDERQKIKSACDDMTSILDDLKEKRDQLSQSKPTSVCLAATVKEIIEKENMKLSNREQRVSFEIVKDAFTAFSNVNESMLKRILGNIIDNASKASENDAEIIVVLSQENDGNIIEVKDQGHGIRREQLGLIGKRGVSFREGGHGLGISFAMEKVEEWGGKVEITSMLNIGTTVTISLPKEKVPKWFSGRLSLKNIKEFILTDDRPVIHSLVKDSLEKNNIGIKKYFHQTSEEFEAWYDKNQKKLVSPIFVFDYDLGDNSRTGIDLIQDFNLESKSILLTNYYDDLLVQTKALNANVKIFPKGLIEYLGREERFTRC